jgi:Flp pilus assembly protein TadG
MKLVRDRSRRAFAAGWIGRVISRLRSEQGGSLVELALSLPILLIVLTGMVACANLFLSWFELTDGIDAGARAVALSRGNTSDPCSTAVNAVYKAAPGLLQSSLTFTITINPNGGTQESYTGSAATSCSSATLGSTGGGTVEVSATYPVPLTAYGIGNKSVSLPAATTELIQ